MINYPFVIKPLSHGDGGGFLISYPDFAARTSGGETVGEAIANGGEALNATIAALKVNKLPVRLLDSGGVASGKFVIPYQKSYPPNQPSGPGLKACRLMPRW